MGFLSVVENDSTSAASFLEKALSRGATNPMAHFYYARALLETHPNGSEIPEPVRASALSALQKTLQADPTHAESARLFGFLRLFDGDPQEGVDVVKKALDANGGNPYLLFVLGQLYGRQENYSAARAIYENLLSRKLSPELNADVRRQLDWVVAKAGTP
jgi:cytochrome c-type biogenesis protein CcmH/NrfG